MFSVVRRNTRVLRQVLNTRPIPSMGNNQLPKLFFSNYGSQGGTKGIVFDKNIEDFLQLAKS